MIFHAWIAGVPVQCRRGSRRISQYGLPAGNTDNVVLSSSYWIHSVYQGPPMYTVTRILHHPGVAPPFCVDVDTFSIDLLPSTAVTSSHFTPWSKTIPNRRRASERKYLRGLHVIEQEERRKQYCLLM